MKLTINLEKFHHYNCISKDVADLIKERNLLQVTVEGEFYHKSCFRCAHGGCFLNPSSYAALDGILYCKPHFSQLFKQKGSYNHLTKTTSMKKNALEQAAVGIEQDSNTEPKAEPDA